jgi:hypothetical protein
VLTWLAVAIILGSAAVYMLRSGSPRSANGQGPVLNAGDRLVEFSPADLERLEFKAPDRTRETVSRDPTTGGWMITLERPLGSNTSGNGAASGGVMVPTARPGGIGVDWPLVDTHVQAFVQKLLDARGVSTPAKDAAITGSPTVLRVFLRGGRTIQFNFADRTLGGLGLVEVIDQPAAPAGDSTPGTPGKARLALIDDGLHRVCMTPGPRSWRDTTALALSKSDVSRIRLEAPAPGGLRVISLGRLDGRWSLREPVAAPADGKSVINLLNTLSGVRISDFLDAGPGNADTQLDKPAAIASLEYDRRTPDGKSDVLKDQLTVGGMASLSSAAGGAGPADRVYARIDDRRIVMIDAKPLTLLGLDPGQYIWPHPTAASASDIGTMLLEIRTADGGSVDTPPSPPSPTTGDSGSSPSAGSNQRVFRRNLDRWARINEDGSEGALVDQSQKDVEGLLAFLTGAGAAASTAPSSVSIVVPPRFTQFGRITLLSLSAGEVERIDLAESGSGLVTFKTGPVYRTYPEDRLPSLVADLRARAKAAGVPIEGFGAGASSPGPDTTK